MNTKLILDFISVGFELLIAYLFFSTFLVRWRIPKVQAAGIYTIVFLFKLAGSYLLPEAWMKTIWALCSYFVLANCFYGTIIKKVTMQGFDKDG